MNFKLKKLGVNVVKSKLILDLMKNKTYLGPLKSNLNPNIRYGLIGVRNDFWVFDVMQIVADLSLVLKLISKVTKKRKNRKGRILFVGFPESEHQSKFLKILYKSKKHYYVNNKSWTSGLLTNGISFTTYRNHFLQNLKTKSEKEKKSFFQKFEGVLNLNKKPDLILIYNHSKNLDAFNEAVLLKIPTISLVNGDSSIDKIDYPVLGNFNSLKNGELFYNLIRHCLK